MRITAALLLLLLSATKETTTAFQPLATSFTRQHPQSSTATTRLSAALKLPEPIISLPSFFGSKPSSVDVAQQFVAAWNARNAEAVLQLLDDDDDAMEWNDYTAWYQPKTGRASIEREVRLQLGIAREQQWVIDDSVVSIENNDSSNFSKVGLLLSASSQNEERQLVLLEINKNKIVRIEPCRAPVWPSGEGGLKVLSLASKFIDQKEKETTDGVNNNSQSSANTKSKTKRTLPERYFDAWNRRDMAAATALFADDAVYDDTAFPGLLEGKERFGTHLRACADALPQSFEFIVDEIVGNNNQNKLLVKWHLENDGAPLPFTRGLSFYELSSSGTKIQRGLDIVDGQPLKTAPLELLVQSSLQQIQQEPAQRLIPLAVWVAYLYVVFLSDGILPGANALQLEPRTWEEVRDLSLNFFLVAPALQLPFAPVVHPMLEGVFNLLLSWAALWAGFLSDDRRDKPNPLPLVPTVIGMQFLTSAFLLPYLATRTTEQRMDVTREELSSAPPVISESRVLGPILGIVGSYSIVWALVGRYADFGSLSERWTSFVDLLSIDRVGSSFLVDLVIFGLFQAWLVDDDLKRRGVAKDGLPKLRWVGKYVPFFGMAAYLALRPQFPTTAEDEDA